MNPIVIIGTGMAGYTVAREFRRLNKETPLMLITSDSGGSYSKPMLSNAFAQKKDAAQLIMQSAEQMATQLNAEIKTGTSVTAIDTAAKTIDTSTGPISYDKLVLAVGAKPIRLALEGDAAERVLSVNNIDDYEAFRKQTAASPSVRIAIIGAGLIGCEFADDLAGAGHAVSVIDPNDRPLAALAAPALSEGLKAALEKLGVAFHLGTSAQKVTQGQNGLQVHLANGSAIEADVVLSAVGLRPDLQLAQLAGLTTKRGIVVDTQGQTSAADVYALGDCAEYTFADGSGHTLPYIAPIMTAGRAIAATLNGAPTGIDIKPSPVLIKTPSYPLALIAPAPHTLANGQWTMENVDNRTVCRFHDAEGVLTGFGTSPHDNAIRQTLLGELGKKKEAA
ncbi:FAD-dependent oxidoreductase [uncultured Oxalicibacterium sp.]|uniref:NAD(P)/FAD-dependent oxidoreductase n=1 Tax=uncultured Oxalicibacterium sp. TaxID=1168540 RepID=UPI0025F44B2E|nr:FAD-dependent oxidoreductase [uncultured Oxalicibacterium sp.]